MTDSPRRWQDLPATPQTDAALRRAAAVIAHGKPWEPHDSRHIAEWTPDTDRNQLARVFMAASERFGPRLRTTRSDQSPWTTALRDPRAALCQLLDLLNIEPPEDLTND